MIISFLFFYFLVMNNLQESSTPPLSTSPSTSLSTSLSQYIPTLPNSLSNSLSTSLFTSPNTNDNEALNNSIRNNKIIKYDYNVFDNLKIVGKGASGMIYSATLMNGKVTVALKSIVVASMELFVNEVKYFLLIILQ